MASMQIMDYEERIMPIIVRIPTALAIIFIPLNIIVGSE